MERGVAERAHADCTYASASSQIATPPRSPAARHFQFAPIAISPIHGQGMCESCKLGNQHAFDSVHDAELVPGTKATAGGIRQLARLATASFGYAVGTCKIGVDELAVVDPTLRVRGVAGLRVADASVMPRIITGPTNAPTHRIAGRASKMILGRDM